ncbi:MAG: cytochrome c peroxidase, partial [Bdellovibrionia bacterium]
MKQQNVFHVLAVILLTTACSGGSSPAGSPQNPPLEEIEIIDKPVRPPVTAATCSTTETPSFAPTLGASSLPPRDFVVPNANGFTGNTWDGRVFLMNRHSPQNGHIGWWLGVFRPERLGTDGDGYPQFPGDSLSEPYEWLQHDEPARHTHIGMYPNTAFPENPYRSNGNGDADANGDHETYEVFILAPVLSEDIRMEIRRGQIVVGRPKTADAYIAVARWTSDFETIQTSSGTTIRGLEPSITFDGRLLLYQGHPKNDGEIGIIMYSYNQNNGAAGGWSTPRSLSDMYHVDRNVLIAGIAFHERYPLAKRQLRDPNGLTYAKGELYQGAYPWISLDGTEVFHTSTIAGCYEGNPNCPEHRWGERALRGGFAGIGRWTNYTMKLIDGTANPDRFAANPIATVRTLTGGLTAFGTMWETFPEQSRFPLPYSPRRPGYGFVGNVRMEYSEATFEDAMDGNYVLFLRMNELVGREKPKWFWEKMSHDRKVYTDQTPDTSTFLNTGVLSGGARFPQEYNGFDGNIGVAGQAIYFPDKGRVEVKNSASLNNLKGGLTVELWFKREIDISNDDPNRYRYLIRKGRSFDLIAEEDGSIQASVTLKGSGTSTVRRRSDHVGHADGWTHVAYSWNPLDGKMKIYLNGELTKELQFEKAEIWTDTSVLTVGPAELVTPLWPNGGQALFAIDDVKVSNTVRTPGEIKASAFASRREQYGTITTPVPSGLRRSQMKVPLNNQPTGESAALGERLFFDPLLSKNRDMSCATCHKPELGFADGQARGIGFEGKVLRRNTPTIFNRAFGAGQFWDGGADSLEEQALVPIASIEEMNLPLTEAIGRLQADPGYVQAFRDIYGG